MVTIQRIGITIDPDDNFWVEQEIRNGEQTTEMKDMFGDIVIIPNRKCIAFLNPDKINHFREYCNRQFPDKKSSNYSFKEFVSMILRGEMIFDDRHICDLTPKLQKRFGFEFEIQTDCKLY